MNDVMFSEFQNILDSVDNREKLVVGLLNNILSDGNASVSDKIDNITAVQLALLAIPLQKLSSSSLDPMVEVKSKESKEIFYILQKLKDSEFKRADYLSAEEIDFTHPKIQRAFEFIVEAFIETLKVVGIDDAVSGRIIEYLGTRMVGFEDELDSRMHGISSKVVGSISNPLLDNFKSAKNKDKLTDTQRELLDKLKEESMSKLQVNQEDIVPPDGSFEVDL